jgi:hypothetical protein
MERRPSACPSEIHRSVKSWWMDCYSVWHAVDGSAVTVVSPYKHEFHQLCELLRRLNQLDRGILSNFLPVMLALETVIVRPERCKVYPEKAVASDSPS